MGFGSKADWLDVKILEALAAWLNDQVLRLDCHELWVKPRAEHLLVERLSPVQVLVIVSILQGNGSHVGFDLRDIEEHVVDLLIVVSVGSTKLVSLSNSLIHFEGVHDSEGHIVDKNRLHVGVHALNLPHHTVKHLHVHAPFGSNRHVRVQSLHDIGGSEDGDIGADRFHFLLTDPFGAQTLALRIGVGTSC